MEVRIKFGMSVCSCACAYAHEIRILVFCFLMNIFRQVSVICEWQ